MKYPATEKLEIICTVEGSHLSARRTLAKIGVSSSTFYRWCDLYVRFGLVGLEDRRSGPPHAWNRIPDKVREDVLDMALCRPELSPHALLGILQNYMTMFPKGRSRQLSVGFIIQILNLAVSPFCNVCAAGGLYNSGERSIAVGLVFFNVYGE